MNIEIDDKARAWLRARVDAGDFPSMEAAIAAAVHRMMLEADGDDLDWAKPLVEEGLADLDAGKAHTHPEVFDRLRARIVERR